jgi:hypothetical protein
MSRKEEILRCAQDDKHLRACVAVFIPSVRGRRPHENSVVSPEFPAERLQPLRWLQAGRAARPCFRPKKSTYIHVFAQKSRLFLRSP